MKKLSEIFDLWYGVNLELINCEEIENGIPFVSRQSVNNGVVGYVRELDIVPNPANTLSIACSGSVLTTFFHDYEYYSGRDVYIAKPKQSLTTEQMLFYAYIIEQNKYRYSFGRQANKTLKNILVPDIDEFPNYANQIHLSDYAFEEKPVIAQKLELNTEKWEWFKIEDIFTLEKCKCSNAGELLEEGHDIAYIGAKKKENGFMRNVVLVPELVTKGNCIVFIGDGQGSVGYTTYQPIDFIGSTTLTAGYSTYLNQFNALFFVVVLDLERYRYSFGRKYGRSVVKEKAIKLPAKNGQPDFEFMENYIKSLNYSKSL
jgi:hypothetical protein